MHRSSAPNQSSVYPVTPVFSVVKIFALFPLTNPNQRVLTDH